MIYPQEPGHRDVDTSVAAAKKINPCVSAMHKRILGLLDRHIGGRTQEEISLALKMKTQTATGRLRELVLAGKVKDSGVRRPTSSGATARVYVTTTPLQGVLRI